MSDEAKTNTSKEAAEESNSDSAQLRDDIEETRSALSETIDAIQEKLDPHHIEDHVLETVHDATVGQVQHFVKAAGEKLGAAAEMIEDEYEEAVEMIEDKYEEAVRKIGVVAGPIYQTARNKSGEVSKVIRRQPVLAAGVAVTAFSLFWLLKSRSVKRRF